MYFLGGIGGKGCGTKFSHPPNSSTIWLQYILGVFPQSCIRWRLRFHSWNQRFYLFKGCNGCQGIHQKQRTCLTCLMFSHEAMPPIRQGCIYRLSDFTTFRMNGCDRGDSEDGGGGFDHAFHAFCLPKNCGYMYFEFENLKFVHSCEQKSSLTLVDPFRWHCLCHWSGHHPRQKELQRWDSAVDVPVIFWRLCSRYLSWHWEKTEETCANLR